jgi:ankyrin repeat protein
MRAMFARAGSAGRPTRRAVPEKLEDAQDEYVARLAAACAGAEPFVDMEMVAIALRHPALANTVDDETGRTLLHLVCRPGPAGTVELEILTQLLDLGADATIADKEGQTPLSIAAEAAVAAPSGPSGAVRVARGDEPEEAARMIVMRGVPCPAFGDDADPAAQALVQDLVNQYRSFKGDLWGYAEQGNTRQAQELIAATQHAPVDAYDPDQGINALGFAVLHRQDDMVALLLQYGADPNVLDHDGRAPLHLLCHTFAHRLAGSVKRTETARESCAEHLLRYGADVNLADKEGQTPLHVACSAGQQGMVRGFILNGAELSSDRAALAGWVAEDPQAPALDGVNASALAAIEDPAVRAVAAAAITKLLDVEPQANEGIVESLVASGLNENGAQRATLAVMHAQPELTPDETLHEAHAWVLQHQQDKEFADPVPFGWRPALTEMPRSFDSQFVAMGIHDGFADIMMPPPEGVPDDGGPLRRRRRPRVTPKDVVPFTERAVVRQSIDSPGVEEETSDEDEEDVVFGGDVLNRQYSMADTDAFDSALDKPWESLSGEELTAAQVLGYTEDEWPQPCKEEDEWPEWEDAAVRHLHIVTLVVATSAATSM